MSDTNDKKTPDEIRSEIDATRGELGFNVDALADKVDPSQIAHRQAEKVKSRFSTAKESVMGSVHDTRQSAESAGDSVKESGKQAVETVKGNPLAVGLVAFGAGWLLSSLVPASAKEQNLAGQVKDKTAPFVDDVKAAAQDAAQNLKEPAEHAAAAVQDSASEAVGTVKAEAQSSASDVKDSAQASKDEIQNT